MNTRKLTGDMSSAVEHDRAELIELRARCERLQHDLNDPPADIQELVIKKLNLVSGEALAASQAKCERLEAHFAALKEASIKFTDEVWAHVPEEQWKNPPVLMALEKLQEARSPLHGKATLDRLEEARRLLAQHKDLAHEVVAFGNCDCNIPKGETCIPCQFAMLNKATDAWLKGG